jgi:hypothetical protein
MTVQPGCGDTGDSGVDGYFHACDAPGSIGPRNGIFVLLGQIGVGLMILESGMHLERGGHRALILLRVL